MKDFEIIFYKKENGECPVSDFLSSLNKVMRYKLMHQLDLLELYGNNPKGDFSKFIRDGIFEVRAQNKTDITRIFYFFDKNRQIVLTHGFVKKTQRLPASELETAKRYREDYLARCQEKELKTAKEKLAEPITNGPKWRPKLDDIVADAAKKSEKAFTGQQKSMGKGNPSRGK